MKKKLAWFFWHLIDVLFPKEPDVVSIELLASSGSLRTLPQSPPPPKSWMNALFEYKNKNVRTLIWQIKYRGNPVLTRAVGGLLAEEILSHIDEYGSFAEKSWVLVPIPATKKHSNERGFDQTKLICEAILVGGVASCLRYAPDTLMKVVATPPQVAVKNRNQRMKNLVGAYRVQDPSVISGKNAIVIDDVLTTGSTFIEAKRALREAGVKHVVAFAVGH